MNITLVTRSASYFLATFLPQGNWSATSRQAIAEVYRAGTEMSFARNQIREMNLPLGITLECLNGSVWVTLDNDPRDVVLAAGQKFTVDRNSRTLIMALEEASVRCTDRPATFQ